MPEFVVIRLPVDEAAALLRVQAATVQRRLRTGELERADGVGGRPTLVLLDPAETWLRVEDAAALLSVTPATVRSNITRGRLDGRREEHGRWRVLLRSVLEDRRCAPEAVALFRGEAAPASPTPAAARSAGLHRSVFVRLSPEEEELLERCRDRHGTIRAAVVVGLRAIDSDDVEDPGELRQEHAFYRERAEQLQAAHDALRARAEGRLVDELYCRVCEQWVPVEECAAVELEDGRLEVFHEMHGHRFGSRFRSDTGLARRRPISRAPA